MPLGSCGCHPNALNRMLGTRSAYRMDTLDLLTPIANARDARVCVIAVAFGNAAPLDLGDGAPCCRCRPAGRPYLRRCRSVRHAIWGERDGVLARRLVFPSWMSARRCRSYWTTVRSVAVCAPLPTGASRHYCRKPRWRRSVERVYCARRTVRSRGDAYRSRHRRSGSDSSVVRDASSTVQAQNNSRKLTQNGVTTSARDVLTICLSGSWSRQYRSSMPIRCCTRLISRARIQRRAG
jgi:hypothetical protein